MIALLLILFGMQTPTDPPLIALWHNNTLVVTMTTSARGCLWLDKTPLPNSCDVYQYRMPMSGVTGADGYDRAYIPHYWQTLRFVSYDAMQIDAIPVPPRSRIRLPMITR